MIDAVYGWCVRQRVVIIRFFQFIFLLFPVFLFAAWQALARDLYVSDLSSLGLTFGESALVIFVIVLLPGIFGRFGIRHKLLSLIKIFRRYLGILMFLLAYSHAAVIRLFPLIQSGQPPSFVSSELFGSLSIALLFPLFLTSNDWSVRTFKGWWYLLHRLMYIIMWTIFAHVALQRVSIWSVLLLLVIIAELSGMIYQRTRKSPQSTI